VLTVSWKADTIKFELRVKYVEFTSGQYELKLNFFQNFSISTSTNYIGIQSFDSEVKHTDKRDFLFKRMLFRQKETQNPPPSVFTHYWQEEYITV
jgi:hypothetical protein